MTHTIYIDGQEVGHYETTTLEPPAQIIIAIAPGIYYQYEAPVLIEDTDD